ncbi:Vps62-related protein [Streptomyces sp. NPDC049577]|uniref:Vps62-related protein n=1 Tax=Streptomyces sp. NPDC049577 TaxID=3155153 RepID=UPI00341959A6
MPAWYERFGELYLAYNLDTSNTNGFFWSSAAVGPKPRPHGDVNVWLATRGNGSGPQFRALGSYARHYGSWIDALSDANFGRYGKEPRLMIAPVNPNSGVVANPVDYQRLWYDSNTGAALYGSVWRPIPPAGYVALGDVWAADWNRKPPLNAIWCVKQGALGGHTYVRRAELRQQVWKDQGTGGNAGDVAIWRVDVPPVVEDSTERLLIPPNTVTTVNNYSTPAPTATSWILDVPAGVEKQPNPSPPPLTSYDRPTSPVVVTDRIVRVPFTGVRDDHRDLEWKVANSPFYRLHRRVAYNVAIFRDNRHGNSTVPDEESVTTGLSASASEFYFEKTTIVVSASAGISFKGLSAEVNSSVTREVGYERRTSVASLELKTTTHGLVTKPRSSGVLWVATHQLAPYRADGSPVTDDLPTYQFPHYASANFPLDAVAEHIPPAAQPDPQFQQSPDIDWETSGDIPGFDGEELTKKLELARQEMPEEP